MLRATLPALVDFLLPVCCAACGRPGEALCESCRTDLFPLLHPCRRCGRDGAAEGCRHCRGRGFAHIGTCHVAWHYRDTLQILVHLAKAGGDAAAVASLCRLLPTVDGDWQAVVPVPAAPGRRRGPHLASALARHSARRLGLPCRHLLRVTRLAAPQHDLNAQQRQRNVTGLFQARVRHRGTQPTRILLVDDLLTSGATASAAAAALRRAGVRRIDLLALARASHADGRHTARRPGELHAASTTR